MTTLEAELGALFAAPPAPLAEVNAPSGPAARAQTCPGVITGNDVGHAILGQLAELIIDFHYLRHYLAIHALAALRDRDRDKLFFDCLLYTSPSPRDS